MTDRISLELLCREVIDCEHKTIPEGDGYAVSVGTKAMKDGRIVLGAAKPVSKISYEAWTRRGVPEPGDLILAREAPVGQVVRVPESPRVCLGQRTVLIRPNPSKVNPHFLHYWLLGPIAQQAMGGQSGGATVAHLNVEDIRNLDVSLIPTDRRLQDDAASVLDAIDDLIENNRRRVTLLEEMARELYREWFVRFRFPGHESTTFQDSPLGTIPEGWTVMAASEALEVNPRIQVPRPEEVSFIAMGDLSEKGMICSPSEVRANGSGAKFANGDTLFARITPCLENGKTGYVQVLADGEVGRGSTEFIVLRGRYVGPRFTYCLARSDIFRAHAIASMSGASGRQRVRNECFDSYFLAVPPPVLAEEFEKVVTSTFSLAKSLSEEAATLASTRDLLLPKLVTGQIGLPRLDTSSLMKGGVDG